MITQNPGTQFWPLWMALLFDVFRLRQCRLSHGAPWAPQVKSDLRCLPGDSRLDKTKNVWLKIHVYSYFRWWNLHLWGWDWFNNSMKSVNSSKNMWISYWCNNSVKSVDSKSKFTNSTQETLGGEIKQNEYLDNYTYNHKSFLYNLDNSIKHQWTLTPVNSSKLHPFFWWVPSLKFAACCEGRNGTRQA